MNRPTHIDTLAPDKCRGAALIVMMFVVVLASTAIFITLLAKTNPEIERQKKTIAALAQAKQALIAWSVTRGDMQPATETTDGVTKYTYYRPGSLPCPDTNHFGHTDSGNESGSCSSTTPGETSIGRLPWRSLRIEKLRDGYGEPLWYAVSNSFRRAGLNNKAINSDTAGTLKLYAADGTTLLTPSGEELAAVIFAPGAPLSGNTDRATKPDEPTSYLDTANGINNAHAAGPFIAGPVKDLEGNLIGNDVLIGISARELIAAVELRALKEAQNGLAAYKEATSSGGKFPRPAPYDGPNCSSTPNVTSGTTALCENNNTTTACIGRLPENALASYVAPWFIQNGWGRTMTYAINDGTGSAAKCPTPVRIDGTINTNAYVLIAPGAAKTGQSRPPLTTQQGLPSSLENYLEDAGNNDAWSGNTDFVTPTSASNDRLRSAP